MDKIILHLDMNSYFASVEQQANPLLRGKPIGVTGKRSERSVVAAASLEAKRLGVKTAMSTWEAKRMCPSIILVAGDPEKYSEIMHRFNAILREFAQRVEPFSVDESFADITDVAKDYFGAAFVCQAIRQRVREECGERVTCSIGVAPNKLMAKLASEQVKPNGLTIVRPRDVLPLLDRVAPEDVCGIGQRIAVRLQELGIGNLKQLREYPLQILVDEFKSYGQWLHEAAWGRGDDEVAGAPNSEQFDLRDEEPKSVGHSYTLPKNTWDLLETKRYLLGLADKVGWRLRRDGFAARCISLHLRFGDFSGFHKQRHSTAPIADGLKLFRMAWQMLPRLSKPIRLVGITASELTRGPQQPTLFPHEQKNAAALTALDALQHRFGEGVWTRATLLATLIKPRSSGFHFDHEI